MDDNGRHDDRTPLGEIFGQLRQINDRLARIETTQVLTNQEHERRLLLLEERPGRLLAAAGTISAVVSGIVGGILWLISKESH
jgi:hypothetical protein